MNIRQCTSGEGHTPRAQISKIDPDATSIPIQTGGGEIVDYKIDSLLTSNIEATVVAHDGLTIAVGGLISDETTIVERRVPGLHRLPMIGNLFRQFTDENEKSELILLITPHVITTPMEGHYKSQARIQALSDHPNISEYSGVGSQPVHDGIVAPSLHQSGHEWDETEKPSWRSESDVEEVEEIPSP